MQVPRHQPHRKLARLTPWAAPPDGSKNRPSPSARSASYTARSSVTLSLVTFVILTLSNRTTPDRNRHVGRSAEWIVECPALSEQRVDRVERLPKAVRAIPTDLDPRQPGSAEQFTEPPGHPRSHLLTVAQPVVVEQDAGMVGEYMPGTG